MSRQHNSKTIKLQSYITEENRNRICKIRGLAWGTTKQDIANFFFEYGVTEGDVVIELEEGKNTGYALIFMKDSNDVDLAKEKLNKQYIKNRYIEFC